MRMRAARCTHGATSLEHIWPGKQSKTPYDECPHTHRYTTRVLLISPLGVSKCHRAQARLSPTKGIYTRAVLVRFGRESLTLGPISLADEQQTRVKSHF